MVDVETLADAVFDSLKVIFGSTVFPALMEMIKEDYLGAEMDARTALVERPDLFERAFVGLLGESGKKILVDICEELCTRFLLDDKKATDLNTRDLAECMAIIPKS
jgi:hypothetical protein